MVEKLDPKTYLEQFSVLPQPADGPKLEAFQKDRDLATSIIERLLATDCPPSIEYFEQIARLEFLIAKNKLPNLIASYLAALNNIRRIRQILVSEDPSFDQLIKSKKKIDLEYEEQLAQSIYVPAPSDPKSIKRFNYIRHEAEKLAHSAEQSKAAQLGFRQLYSKYSTAPTKARS